MPRLNNADAWTYGAEHELSDWDTTVALPLGFARSPDYTIVNSNGIAAQPNTRVYSYGGEINTPPTCIAVEQANLLDTILREYPNCKINHRSNLHIHIRVPGLKDDLELLKQIQSYIHRELPKVINLIEPIPRGVTAAEKKREKRRKVSHHTFLTPQRLAKQLQAKTCKEFFELECPIDRNGRVMWHAQPRLAVGLRQLLQTDTVEFRHFPGTLNVGPLYSCILWCHEFMLAAIVDRPVEAVWSQFRPTQFPTFPVFDEELEIGYQATAQHSGLSQSEVKENIQMILEGKFHGSAAYERAKARARGVSR